MSAVWKNHTVDFAWPTLALGVGVVAGHGLMWGAVLTEQLSLGVGFAAQTLIAYLAFTVAHEAAHGNIHGRHPGLRRLGEALGWVSSVLLFAPFPAF